MSFLSKNLSLLALLAASAVAAENLGNNTTDSNASNKAVHGKKSDASATLDSVVVSASKIEQSTLEAPTNVSVVTSKDIENENNQRLGDALNVKVPGLYLRGGALGNSRPGVTMLSSMRGQGGTLTKIAVMVDGMNMIDAYSGQVNWSMVSMDDVDRIEVVPGTSSSLYGGGAMGGLINITTKAPTKEEALINLTKGYGDLFGNKESFLYQNKFKNGLGIVFGASRDDRRGYVDTYVTKTPSGAGGTAVSGAIPTTTTTGAKTYIIGDKGFSGSLQKDYKIKLFYDVNEYSKLNFGLSYTDNKSLLSGYNSYLTNSSTGAPLNITSTSQNINIDGKKTTVKEQDFATSLPMGNTALRYNAGYETKFGETNFDFKVGKIDRKSWNSTIDSTSSSTTLTSGPGYLSDSPNSTTTATAQFTTPFANNLFVYGVSSEYDELHQKRYKLNNWTDQDSRSGTMDSIDARSLTNSLFVQDQIEIGDKILLYVGGRYDSWSAKGRGEIKTSVSGGVVGLYDYDERKDGAVSPKIAVVYQLLNNLSLKSSLGTGFRTPTNYYLYANPTYSGNKLIHANPNLKPEKATAFDIGMEYHFAHGGQATATYFYTKTKDLIYQKQVTVTPYVLPVGTVNQEAYQDNTGESIARGVELALEYPLADWLKASCSYSYTDSKITKDTTNTGMEGKFVTNVPRDTASAALETKFGKFSSVFSGRYVGKVYSNNDNSDEFKNVYTGYSIYYVFNLKANYQLTKNTKISFAVDNIFDREYYEYYRMPGVGYSLSLTAKF